MTTDRHAGSTRPTAPIEAPHASDVAAVCSTLQCDFTVGLSSAEVAARLRRYGPNRLPEPQRVSPLRLFLRQFANYMIYILLAAMALSLLLGDREDTVVIAIVVIANAVIGFVQEYRAERALESLKKMAGPEATVLRDGQVEVAPATTLVPGDVVLLEEGVAVPADVRLAETIHLEVDESILTGESLPVEKSIRALADPQTAVADRRNMAFLGTMVTAGRGRGVVVGTGATTEIGRIAATLALPVEKPTPLQLKLVALGKALVAATAALCVLFGAIGVLQGRPFTEMVFTTISLAVAAIPEGLVAVVTATMAVGVQIMARRNAIVRNLPAVETLGSVTMICSDKTGTLTEGRMAATDIWVGGRFHRVSGTGITPEGVISLDGEPVAELPPSLELAIVIMALCNNAALHQTESGAWTAVGDPTEVALQALAHKVGRGKPTLAQRWRFVGEHTFGSLRKRMSVVYASPDGRTRLLTKGAPEAALAVSAHWERDGAIAPLTEAARRAIEDAADAMAARGLRVLGLAWRVVGDDATDVETAERDLIFQGLVGLSDPPRPEAAPAVRRCAEAGIQVLMVTGDHRATAVSIAREVGIIGPADDGALSGPELDALTEDELTLLEPLPRVFARVSPDSKLKLVRALRHRGHVVAMTGDGVNDAAAIKHANVGVAMGRTGTDVAKQAADIVLSDDNFATIIAAVEEGRRIFDNIRKFIIYLLSCNTGEVFAMLLAMVAGIPLPLTPLQILWLNLVTDTPPALALGFDPALGDAMRRPPRDPQQGLFSRLDVANIVFHGLVIGLVTLVVFVVALHRDDASLDRARTMAFAALALLQLAHSFNCRSESVSLFRIGILGNRWLVGAVGLSVALVGVGIYVPFVSRVFEQEGLVLAEWAELGIGVGAFVAVAELFKLARRRAGG